MEGRTILAFSLLNVVEAVDYVIVPSVGPNVLICPLYIEIYCEGVFNSVNPLIGLHYSNGLLLQDFVSSLVGVNKQLFVCTAFNPDVTGANPEPGVMIGESLVIKSSDLTGTMRGVVHYKLMELPS